MSNETKLAMEAAIEAHMADTHEDPTLILEAYIIQAMGNGVNNERNMLSCDAKAGQSGVVSLGLLSYITYNVEGQTFDQYSDSEEESDD